MNLAPWPCICLPFIIELFLLGLLNSQQQEQAGAASSPLRCPRVTSRALTTVVLLRLSVENTRMSMRDQEKAFFF